LALTASEEEREMNVSQLIEQLPDEFPMDEVLKRDFDVIQVPINGSTTIKVKGIEYYESVIEFLKNQTSMNSFINFALWTWVRLMAEAEGTKLNDVYLEYKHNTSISDEGKGKVRTTDDNNVKREQCLRQLLQRDIMYSAGASYYSRFKFNRSSRDEATRIFNFTLAQFMLFVQNNTWMSEETRGDALKLLSSMEVVIGYPDWILVNSTIDYLYRYAKNVSKDASFVEHYYQLKENDHFQSLLILNYCFIDKKNEEVTLRSHAAYKVESNTLGYPAASLVTHYRGTSYSEGSELRNSRNNLRAASHYHHRKVQWHEPSK
ncbi:hypothetical protein MTO96_045563, partial [Rhipicephalus appendiculatus]